MKNNNLTPKAIREEEQTKPKVSRRKILKKRGEISKKQRKKQTNKQKQTLKIIETKSSLKRQTKLMTFSKTHQEKKGENTN